MKTIPPGKRQSNALIYFTLICLFLVMDTFGILAMDIRISGTANLEEQDEIEDILHDAAEEFLPRFGIDSNFRLAIYICKDTREFTRLTGAHWWNGGHFTNRTIYLQRIQPLKQRGILAQTVKHEFLHYCIRRNAGNNIPQWLNEGIVLNLTGEINRFDCPNKSENENITPEQIERMLHSKKMEDVRNGYCLAAIRVKKLLKKISLTQCLDIN